MTWSQIRWPDSEAAWGYFAVFAIAAGYLLLFAWRSRVMRRSGDHPLVAQMASETSRGRQIAKAFMVIAASALLVTALLRPKYGVREGEVANTGIDIAIVLDVSKSMKVRDVVPDRLGGAELEIRALLDRLHGGRIALVPFAGIPFVQTPLTSDFQVVRSYMRDLAVSEMPVGGTAVGRALRLAMEVLDTEEEAVKLAKELGITEVDQFAGSKYKAVILFTDGEDHESEPLEVAGELADKGIRVFTVGVGSRSGNAIPVLTEDGSVVGYQKAADGKTPLISELNEELLRDIAKATDGAYFHYANRSISDELYQQIDKLEKREYETRFDKMGEERFQIALLPAILLLLAELLLSDRRRETRAARRALRARRRASRKKGLAVTASALLALFGAGQGGCSADSAAGQLLRTTNHHIDDGNELLASDQPKQALGEYERAKAELPESATLDYDIGTAQLLLGEYEAAVSTLTRALDQADEPLRGPILYNLGLANARWGLALEQASGQEEMALSKWKAATDRFEQLVLRDPEDEGAKWNLEVALLRVDPPCGRRNDGFEPNDQPAAAKPLELQADPETGEKKAEADLVLCPNDQDWFALPLDEGDRLTLSMKVKPAEGADPSPEGGPVALELYDTGAEVRLGSSIDSPEGSTTIAFTAPAGGVYAVKLQGRTDDEYGVSLTALAVPSCDKLEDAYEQNDELSSAAPVEDGEKIELRLCPGDPDWFRVTLGVDESLFAFATAGKPHAEGFSMRLYDEAGTLRAVAAAHEDSRIAALLTPGPGSYRIELSGTDTTEAKVDLQVKVLPPCPEGNDPLEPNDTPGQARTLEELAQAAPQMPAIPGQPGMPGMPQPMPGAPMPGQPGMPSPSPVPPSGVLPPPGVPGVRPNVPGPGPQAQPPMAAPGAGDDQGASAALLRICDGDVDWVKVTMDADQKKVATILFDHGKGDLDLALFDETGSNLLVESVNSSEAINAESLALPAKAEPVTYLLRVQGKPGAENFYVLRLDTPQDNQGDGESDENKKDQQKQEDKDDEEQEKEKEQDEKKPEDEPKDQKQDQDQDQQKPQPEQSNPIEDALEQLDRNEENLEAREALIRSPFRNVEPEKDW